MGQVRSYDTPEVSEYKNQLQYLKKASLYQMNEGLSKANKKNYLNIAAPILIDQDPPSEFLKKSIEGFSKKKIPRIEDSHPKLFNELNDSNSSIPAYIRF